MFRSEMSVPIYSDNRTERSNSRSEIPKPISISRGDERSYSSMGSRPSDYDFRQRMRRGSIDDPRRFGRSTDGHFEDITPLRISKDSDSWFDDMRRRFEERRRQWDEEVQRMRADFFTPPSRSELQPGVVKPTPSPTLEKRVSTKYEYGGDGKLYYMATFDVRDYEPSDVKVTLRNGEIVVNACAQNTRVSSYRTKEFTRSVYLPNDVDQVNISASIDLDNMLVVKCPVRSPIPNIAPVSKISTGTTRGDSYPVRKNRISPILTAGTSRIPETPSSTFNIDIPIGEEYGPGEIQVRTMNDRVYVSARHDEKMANQNTFREFSKEYDIADHIDPKSITATLEKGILHLVGYPFAKNT